MAVSFMCNGWIEKSCHIYFPLNNEMSKLNIEDNVD